MDADLRRRLSAIVGEGSIDDVVHPANVTQVRELLVLGRAAGIRFLPVAHGAASTTDVLVAADRLTPVTLNASSLLLHAGAAATWEAVRQSAQVAGLAVATLDAVRQDTVGASVATGELSHRAIAGIEILTPGGQLIAAGGRTLKDVVGYDLAGLALGSGSALGAILAVTLRLEPAAARTPAQAGPGPWRGDAGIAVVAAFLEA